MRVEGGNRWIRFAPAAASVGKSSASRMHNWANALECAEAVVAMQPDIRR